MFLYVHLLSHLTSRSLQSIHILQVFPVLSDSLIFGSLPPCAYYLFSPTMGPNIPVSSLVAGCRTVEEKLSARMLEEIILLISLL